MLPGIARAEGAAPGRGLPRRMAFVYVPNGVNMSDWTPSGVGDSFELPMILEPLRPVQKDILVLSGLAHDKARPNGDGAGDHARASATFLTACQAKKTDGADIKVGVSVDQVAALRVGDQTRLRSLELGCDRGQQSGNCDSGYSCAYSFNVSWRTPSTPMPPLVDPRLVFERLFSTDRPGETPESRARRQRHQKSILDFAMEDAGRLRGQLGANDRRKLDEYLTAVRELEQRIEHAERVAQALPDMKAPTGVPPTYEAHLRLMFDLLALAFQTDSTRIATFMMAHDGSNRAYPFIGVPDGHHELSHHGGSDEKKARIAKINRFHLEQFAYFIQRLKTTPEGEGSLLDQCMVVYGSGIADGNSHAHHDLPVLMAGRGGGAIRTGRHVKHPANTPMANLFLSILDTAGAPTERIGDSTGRLKTLA